MPSGREQKVTANFPGSAPSGHLKDVDQNAWYHEHVDYVVEKGLMKGIGGRQFAP